jgi:hypothetical protein
MWLGNSALFYADRRWQIFEDGLEIETGAERSYRSRVGPRVVSNRVNASTTLRRPS